MRALLFVLFLLSFNSKVIDFNINLKQLRKENNHFLGKFGMK